MINNKGFSNNREEKYAEKDCALGNHYSLPTERPKFYVVDVVSENSSDRCVMPGCGKDTGYLITTPVQQRMNYVEGAGQLCSPCYSTTYGGRNG